MILNPISLGGSFSKSLLYHFPRKNNAIVTLKPSLSPSKRFRRNLARLQFASNALEEVSDPENGRNLKGIEFLHLMEERGIHANCQTYVWLLESWLNSGLFVDCKKLHGKILKVGIGRDHVLCNKLMDVYRAAGDLDGVTKVFDDMPHRSVLSWNKLLSGVFANKLCSRVLALFSRMAAERVNPTEVTFAYVLRACAGGNVAFHCIGQIHAKIVCYGFGTSPSLCNPLIDSYAKNGIISSARKVFDKLCLKDSVSWLAMISGFSQNGYEYEAIDLFCQMHMSGPFPTPYIISSVLSACSKIKFFGIAEQLHGLALKWDFSLEIYVCNALVTFYSRIRDFIAAEQVFRKMQCKDEVSYNSLISGLAQQGCGGRALELFEKMQLDHLKPDCVTVASILSACALTGALCMGEQLHSYVIRVGMCQDIIIEGSLLDLYVKSSDLKTAHRFFCTTRTENVVLWNVMLVAYGQLLDLNESFHMFRQMQTEGLIPNQFTFPSILRTCTSVGALDLGEQIHTQVMKTGFQFDLYVCSVLIDMYAKLGKLEAALGILRRLTAQDVVSWTAMISGYIQHDLFTEALRLFEEMLNQGIQLDNIGFSSAITACAGLQALNQGQQIHAQSYVVGYSEDLSIGNALISLYARCGKIEEAYLAFSQINSKDNISWNGLISGFAQSGFCEEALKVFAYMNRANVEPSLFTFGSAVSAAANTASINQGKQIHAMIIKRGFDSEIEVSNTLISLYSKCGCIGDAKREFSEMPEKSDISWNAMITAYSQHGHGVKAVKLFETMKQVGEMPNHATFVAVLSACSHVGSLEEGLWYFESMNKEHGLIPKLEHYACIVDLLARAGLLTRARKFIEEMPIEPDAMIWRILLSACTVHKNKEVGEFAAHHLLELKPEDSATYVLLSNMFAVTGNWNSRDSVRRLMKDRGVKKEPGRSWIEVKNSVHAFFVGDRLHPLAEKIYDFLSDLNEWATGIGYVQDQNNLLNDTEQGKKDPTAYIHSEKLAIAFGLLSLSDPIPVRVMKNLRVCNDCHTWIKYVSKVSNREIIVRDTYRFHHFVDGVCSCKDYW